MVLGDGALQSDYVMKVEPPWLGLVLLSKSLMSSLDPCAR